MVRLVVRFSARAVSGGTTEASERDRVRFLAAGHLREVFVRLALLVSGGSHVPIMAEPVPRWVPVGWVELGHHGAQEV